MWCRPVREGSDVLTDVRQHLEWLEQLPVGEQVAAYDALHQLLQGALGRVDEG